MIVLGLIVLVSINLGGCWPFIMMLPAPGSFEIGLSDEEITNLVNDELVKMGAHRSDLLGIDGPVRSIQACNHFRLHYGSRYGPVRLSILPSKNSPISKPILLSQTKYELKLIKKGVVEIHQHPERDEIVDVVTFALMTEQSAMSTAENSIISLPVTTETIRRGWIEALEKVVFHLGQWRFFFTKPGIIPSDFGDDICISVDADTLEVSISGMNPIEFARTAIAHDGFDASQAKFDIIICPES